MKITHFMMYSVRAAGHWKFKFNLHDCKKVGANREEGIPVEDARRLVAEKNTNPDFVYYLECDA